MQDQSNIVLYKNTKIRDLKRKRTLKMDSNREMSNGESFQNESELIQNNIITQNVRFQSIEKKNQNNVDTMKSFQQSLSESLVILKNLCQSGYEQKSIVQNFQKVVQLVKDFERKFQNQLIKAQDHAFNIGEVLETKSQNVKHCPNLVKNLQALVLHKEQIICEKNAVIKNLKNRNFLLAINKKFQNQQQEELQNQGSFERGMKASKLLQSDFMQKDIQYSKKNSLNNSDVQSLMQSTLFRKTTYDPAKQKVMRYAELIELKVKEKLEMYKKLIKEGNQNIEKENQDKKLSKLKEYFQGIQRKNIQNIVKIKKMLKKKLYHSNEQQIGLRQSWLKLIAFQKLEKILQTQFFSKEEIEKAKENIEKRIGKKDLNLKTLSFQSQDSSLDTQEQNCKLNNRQLVIKQCYMKIFNNTKQKDINENFQNKKFEIVNFDKKEEKDEFSLLKLESIQFNLMKRINDIDQKQLKQHLMHLEKSSKDGTDRFTSLKTSSDRNSSEIQSNIFKFKNN